MEKAATCKIFLDQKLEKSFHELKGDHLKSKRLNNTSELENKTKGILYDDDDDDDDNDEEDDDDQLS